MQERGEIYNDLHMYNVMIRPDDTIALIDFETDSHNSEGNGGPSAIRASRRIATDRLRHRRLQHELHPADMNMPLTTLFQLDRRKTAQIETEIEKHFEITPSTSINQYGTSTTTRLPKALTTPLMKEPRKERKKDLLKTRKNKHGTN